MSELPEKLRRQLKPLSASNFGVLLAQVDEEEDDYQAAREDASSWTRVERRSTRRPDRGHEQRAPQATTHPVRQDRPARNRPAGEQRRGERRERLRCWECGSTRHLARSCPQIYRRDQREAGRRPRPEPMEVNAVRGPRRNHHAGECSITHRTRTGPGFPSESSGGTGRGLSVRRGPPVRLHPTPVRRASRRDPPVGGNRGIARRQAGEVSKVGQVFAILCL
ncbi:hypothetical protein AAG570_001410 [Ranatra chinensis]|uniref:CCHC-type domain-containing protein n=1 Tax=Ranatra chinensis TaxID=642074 RepID=A0ABD0YDQ1_9HEMI